MHFTSSSVSRRAAEQLLTEQNITVLMRLMHNFSDKWRTIGMELGFTLAELNQINSKPLLLITAPTSYLTELLSQWVEWPTVNHPTKPTLEALCETLRSSVVGLGSLAEKVEREMKCHMIGKILICSMTAGCLMGGNYI